MCTPDASGAELWELVLYARPPVLDGFPRAVFFDDDIVWHQQQFGLDGHVATAAVFERGTDLFVCNLVSDLVQRIGRRRDLKTQVENRFKGWARLLVNAALQLAIDHGDRRVLVATADSALSHTDQSRGVQRPLFDRVYDGAVRPPFHAVRDGDWWVLDVAANAAAVLHAEPTLLSRGDEPTICVLHDIERGWGHLDEPEFATGADAAAPGHLARMLDVEADLGVRATYSVVGFMVPDLARQIRAGGHTVAFHSYDHAAEDEDGCDDQLARCREVDYRIKGYRPARSRLGPELTNDNLAFHNFEWLASSAHSLGATQPALTHGVVRLPIHFDDFALHRGATYADWHRTHVATLGTAAFSAFSLHDCYAAHWLDRYPELLREVARLGRVRTLDEVAAEVLLTHAA